MTSETRSLCKRSRFLGIAGTLLLALWLTTATASPAQTFNVLHNFDGTDGANPGTTLVQGRDGNFYGVTGGWLGEGGGGAYGDGTVFKITPTGKLAVLHNFNGTDGTGPNGPLILATDGGFYGTTVWGGHPPTCSQAVGCGTVFKITAAGDLTTLYNLCSETNCADGAWPTGGLIQATDGNLYGTTNVGGANGNGTVFKITRAGGLTTLYSFCSRTNCTDGYGPWAGLIQATDGSFYGTTMAGGANTACSNQWSQTGCGTVFKITRAGKLTTLHSFDGSDGATPFGGLVQAADGNLYGTTGLGGASNAGTVFKITPAGTLTTLHNFDGTDGNWPTAGLIQASDGNFYGTTEQGGVAPNSTGTVFQITPAGILTMLHNFKNDGSEGGRIWAGLLQATNGTFYGAAMYWAAYGDGSVFSLSTGLGPFATFVLDSGKVGWTAEILGQGFTGTTGVSFNGTPSTSFIVKNDTYLRATVPAGATTGPVTVTTPSGTLTSNVPYRVRPTIIGFNPTSGTVGTQVIITGVSLTQTEKVNFGGVHASFTVNSDTQVTATVPSGAKTGKIAIVTAGGKTWSMQDFTVTQ